jgi:hypothetical protein
MACQFLNEIHRRAQVDLQMSGGGNKHSECISKNDNEALVSKDYGVIRNELELS